jgi:hypothetical protein
MFHKVFPSLSQAQLKTRKMSMVSPSHISPLLMCSETEVCILSWVYFEEAVIYLAVGRPIEHWEMGHAFLAAGSPPYVLRTRLLGSQILNANDFLHGLTLWFSVSAALHPEYFFFSRNRGPIHCCVE